MVSSNPRRHRRGRPSLPSVPAFARGIWANPRPLPTQTQLEAKSKINNAKPDCQHFSPPLDTPHGVCGPKRPRSPTKVRHQDRPDVKPPAQHGLAGVFLPRPSSKISTGSPSGGSLGNPSGGESEPISNAMSYLTPPSLTEMKRYSNPCSNVTDPALLHNQIPLTAPDRRLCASPSGNI